VVRGFEEVGFELREGKFGHGVICDEDFL
jgi:hypothetical protein